VAETRPRCASQRERPEKLTRTYIEPGAAGLDGRQFVTRSVIVSNRTDIE
jgi:hypothetical protein